MITFRQKGDFSKTLVFFEKLLNIFHSGILDKYGREGVEALQSATPVDTGKTAESWRYVIKNLQNGMAIEFHNDNVPENLNVSVAVLLQYGHGTRNGGWVQGIDYINPTVRPVFERMVDELTRKMEGK